MPHCSHLTSVQVLKESRRLLGTGLSATTALGTAAALTLGGAAPGTGAAAALGSAGPAASGAAALGCGAALALAWQVTKINEYKGRY